MRNLFLRARLVQNFEDGGVWSQANWQFALLVDKCADHMQVEQFFACPLPKLIFHARIHFLEKAYVGVDIGYFFGDESDCVFLEQISDVGVFVVYDLFNLLV